MNYAPANIVSPFQYMQLLGSVAVGYLFFGDFPDLYGLGRRRHHRRRGPLHRLVPAKAVALQPTVTGEKSTYQLFGWT